MAPDWQKNNILISGPNVNKLKQSSWQKDKVSKCQTTGQMQLVPPTYMNYQFLW
jgi:hypothetical protein